MKCLITGSGTLGTELAIKLLHRNDWCSPALGPADGPVNCTLVMLDHSEDALWRTQEAVKKAVDDGILEPYGASFISYKLGDIRNKETVMDILMPGKLMPGKYVSEVDTIIHTAALKHVTFTNDNVAECIDVNVNGTVNLLKCMRRSQVMNFVNVSSDKACYPSNVYGQTKKLTEQATRWYAQETGRNIFSVRMGNFLGSRGSVIDRWKEQHTAAHPLALTDPKMNRFFIKPREVADFIIKGIDKKWNDGDIYIPWMRVINMKDLVSAVATKWGTGYEIVGAMKGEKTDEMLVGYDEMERLDGYQNDSMVIRWKGVSDKRNGECMSTASVPVQSFDSVMRYIEDVV